MDSVVTTVDPRDVADINFIPDIDQNTTQDAIGPIPDEGIPTKRPYNKIPFVNCGPLLAKLQSGSEDLAKLLTAFCDDLYEDGHLAETLTITRSKIESAIRKDGEKRMRALSKKWVQGM